MNNTQLRVLAALRSHGSLTPRDFRYPTIDGGDEMDRLAARINELRDAGHNIVTTIEVTARRKRYARYQLHGEAASDVPSPSAALRGPAESSPGGASETAPPLFELPVQASGHYGDAA